MLPKAPPPAFQYSFKIPEQTDAAAFSMTAKEVSQVPCIHDLLVAQVPLPHNSDHLKSSMKRLYKKLFQKNTCMLQYVCQTLSCMPTKAKQSKTNYVDALVKWVSVFSRLPDDDKLMMFLIAE